MKKSICFMEQYHKLQNQSFKNVSKKIESATKVK
jgi:hypothetical protein